MTIQTLLRTMQSKLDAMPEDKSAALIAHVLQRIEEDALRTERQQDAARRRAAMLAKYPFLDSEYVRAIEFHYDGRLKSIDLHVDIDSLCRIEMRPGNNGRWRVVQCWEGDDEFNDGVNDVADFTGMVALMRRIENKVSALEIIE